MSAAARQRRGYAQVSPLRRTLRRLPDEMTAEVRKEFEEVANLIHADAVARVPVKEGVLKRWLSKRTGRDKLSAEVGFITRAQKRRAFYAAFVEFGTKPSRKGDLVPRLDRGRVRFRPAARSHPGTRPRPFLGPAFRAHRDEALRRINRAIKRALDRAASERFIPKGKR